jgi:recombinational DNA repair ATPase RecF
VTPVSPVSQELRDIYERFTKRKEALLEKKKAATETLRTLETKLTERTSDAGKYRAPTTQDDPILSSKRIEISNQTALVRAVSDELDEHMSKNSAIQEYMTLHAEMEESYIATKALEEESRKTWSALYSQ